MPTCAQCRHWTPPSAGVRECPRCGGDLRSGAARERGAAKAAAQGLTFDAYQEKQRRARESERRRAEELARAAAEEASANPHWDHHPPGWEAGTHGQAGSLAWVFLVLPLTGLLGLVLLVAFVLLGLPAWVPIIGTIAGASGGVFLTIGLDAGSWSVLDWLAYRVSWVDRHGEQVWDLFFVVALTMSPVMTLVATIVLLWVAT